MKTEDHFLSGEFPVVKGEEDQKKKKGLKQWPKKVGLKVETLNWEYEGVPVPVEFLKWVWKQK